MEHTQFAYWSSIDVFSLLTCADKLINKQRNHFRVPRNLTQRYEQQSKVSWSSLSSSSCSLPSTTHPSSSLGASPCCGCSSDAATPSNTTAISLHLPDSRYTSIVVHPTYLPTYIPTCQEHDEIKRRFNMVAKLCSSASFPGAQLFL